MRLLAVNRVRAPAVLCPSCPRFGSDPCFWLAPGRLVLFEPGGGQGRVSNHGLGSHF